MISSGLGRYGPFVLHDGTYANLEFDRRRLLDRPEPRRLGDCRQAVARPVPVVAVAPRSRSKELGDHPDGGAITVRDGRYGPYVNWGKVNATLAARARIRQSVNGRRGARPHCRACMPRAASNGQGQGDARPKTTKSSKAATDGATKKTQPRPRRLPRQNQRRPRRPRRTDLDQNTARPDPKDPAKGSPARKRAARQRPRRRRRQPSIIHGARSAARRADALHRRESGHAPPSAKLPKHSA